MQLNMCLVSKELKTIFIRSTHCAFFSDEDDNSNSSNDSDQLQTSGYHGDHRQSDAPKPSAPVCRADSISISAMEDCPTDHEVSVGGRRGGGCGGGGIIFMR